MRSPLRLSLTEREEISRGLAGGESLRAIACGGWAGRLRRCRVRWQRTAAGAAIGHAAPTRPRSDVCVCEAVEARGVSARLRGGGEGEARELGWSPQQISGWLVRHSPMIRRSRVSHETIYLSLFVQSRGALRKELTRYLRSGHSTRRPKGHTVMNGQGQLRGTLNIRERPADANDRAVPGHWEGDLLMGKRMHAMATLVERKSRFVMLIALPNGHAADVVADALAAKIVELPEQLRQSLTWDQGKEMADHARFTINTGVQVYFCDPRSPWQRAGAATRTPTVCSASTSRSGPRSRTTAKLELERVAAELNGRPRQTLGWKTPSQALDEALR